MRSIGRPITLLCVLAVLSAGALVPGGAGASSHREAPYTSTDPQVDATDLYAYVSPNRPDTVTFLANYVPFQIQASGPNFYKFGDDVLYEFNIDNDGDAKDDLSFQFDFRTRVNNKNTFLYNTGVVTSLNDPDLNQEQFYNVSVLRERQHADAQRKGTVIARDLQAAPAYVGPVSFPNYPKVARQAEREGEFPAGCQNPCEMEIFAGPRDDPFFIDLGGTFDLLQLRALRGKKPVDDLAGLNVLTLAIRVPMKMLTRDGKMPSGAKDPDAILGVRTTSYRKSMSVLRPGTFGGGFQQVKRSSGPYVQLSRLDSPLVNEVVIPIRDKDRWNGSKPINDGQFLRYVTDPELARLFEAVLGVDTPPPPRNDLVTIFLTGIPGLNQPKNVVPSSQLRLNMGIGPTRNPNRLGVLGGDNAGFPNGRRPIDDVVDIELRAVAGGTPFTPAFNKAPNNRLGDGVNANDVPFMRGDFPYLAIPHQYEEAGP